MGITREEVKEVLDDMFHNVEEEDKKQRIYNLYTGMTESMQKAVLDIMLVANGEDIE